MKKMLVTVGLVLMTSLMVLPALAQQCEKDRTGPGMMEQGYSASPRSFVDEETLKAYDEEMEKHDKDTANQRLDILVKQHEMATLLINPKTTKDELMVKQKELQGSMNAWQQAELSFRWDIHKKYPEMTPDVYGGCLASAAGNGGNGMMGRGNGMMGQGMMNPDDPDGHNRGMMGSGRNKWRY